MTHESDAHWHAFVEHHRVCWEAIPLREMVKGHGIQQTGIELHLLGQWMGLDPGRSQGESLDHLVGDLHELAHLVVPARAPGFHIEVLPYDRSGHYRPETQQATEVQATVLFTPADPDEPPSAEAARVLLQEVEAHLKTFGVHRGTWKAQA